MKKKLLSLFVVLTILCSLFSINAIATENVSYDIKLSKDFVTIGNEFDVVISLTNYKELDTGFRGVQIDINEVDTALISVESHESLVKDDNSFSNKTSYSDNDNRIRYVYVNYPEVLDKNVTDIMKVTFKINDNLSEAGSLVLPITIKIGTDTQENIILNSSINIDYDFEVHNYNVSNTNFDYIIKNGKIVIVKCNDSEMITIPDRIDNFDVTAIEKSAFSACKSLKYVFYTSTKDAWDNITVNEDTDFLNNADVHYSAVVDNEIEVINTKPTCENDGYNEYICNVCNELLYTIEDTNSALGHTFKDYVTNNDAKCEVDGTKTAPCVNGCGKTNTITDEGSALKHEYKDYISNNDAKCEVDGTKTAPCVNGCGKTNTITDEGSALGHEFKNYVSNNDAKCEEDGTKTAICENGCGKKNTINDDKSALEHSFENYISNNDATCDADGTKTAICENGCGLTNTIIDEGSQTIHKYTKYVSNNDATCTKNYTETATCDNGCGSQHTRVVEGTALGHSFDNYISNNNATCTEDGTETSECVRKCGKKDIRTEIGSALGHSFEKYISDNNATCTEDGTETSECIRKCGIKDTRAAKGSALGHSFEKYISDNNATCTEDGTETSECIRKCGMKDTRTEIDSALGHMFTEYVSDNNATVNADGTKTAKCDRGCGATVTIVDEGSKIKTISPIDDNISIIVDEEDNTKRMFVKSNTAFKAIIEKFENSELLQIVDMASEAIAAEANVGTGYILQMVWNENVVDQIELILAGDINGDAMINSKDVTFIRRYIAAWDIDLDKDAADVTNDEEITAKDVVLIRRYIAGWESEL